MCCSAVSSRIPSSVYGTSATPASSSTARSRSGRLLMTEVPGAGVAVRHSPSAGIAIAGAVGVAIGAVLWGTFGPRPAADSREPRCVTLTMPPDVTVNGVQLSPDGRMLVVRGRPKTPEGSVAARDRLYARTLETFEFKVIPGTDGVAGFGIPNDGRPLPICPPISS